MFKAKRSHIETRKEVERNLNLLREAVIHDKVKFSEENGGLQMIENGFKSARFLPNRRIDFATIDVSVRLMANTVAQQLNNVEL